LHLAKAPNAAMSEDALLDCIDWISPGFEIVFSPFPGWSFAAADAAAAYGLHGMLLVGERSGIAGDRAGWGRALREFTVELSGSSGTRASGHAANVLGGPIEALRFLVEELDRFPASPPLAPGEIVTTGTLTEAMPAVPGDTWTATFTGLRVRDAELTLA
jgi:2-oxo-3-hexenedioate decarboxylase